MRGLSSEWPERSLPIATDGGGNLLTVSLDGESVELFDHETWEFTELAPDFGTWMGWLADDMEAGLVVFDEDESEYEDALTLLAKAPKKPELSVT
jgi:hypothetical protein